MKVWMVEGNDGAVYMGSDTTYLQVVQTGAPTRVLPEKAWDVFKAAVEAFDRSYFKGMDPDEPIDHEDYDHYFEQENLKSCVIAESNIDDGVYTRTWEYSPEHGLCQMSRMKSTDA